MYLSYFSYSLDAYDAALAADSERFKVPGFASSYEIPPPPKQKSKEVRNIIRSLNLEKIWLASGKNV
jgi:hypothetical protein